VSRLRPLLSLCLAVLFPLATFASDKPEQAAGMLYAHGKVQLNGTGSPNTIALFTGDWVQTQADSVANITATGSSVLVMPNGFVKFDPKALDLSHGDVVVSTMKGLAVKADAFTIAPAAEKQSKFEVAENEDTVVVAAREGDVTVSDGQDTTTVPQGQQTTRSRKKAGGAIPAASGAPMSGKTAAILAGAVGAAAVGAVIVTTGNKKCVSPGTKNCCNQNQQGNNNCQ
jgi:hypothetical protein